MASSSSENMASIETLSFRPTFIDSWLSEAFSRDTQALTRALQQSISNTNNPLLLPTPSGSNISGPDPETTLKRHRSDTFSPVPATGKVSKAKRKTRTSKRSQTTFIKADPANFRQLVQQVTGVGFGNGLMAAPAQIMTSDPLRYGCLPTLDTSDFLLDQQYHHQPSSVMVDGVASGDASLDCDNFPLFPTLESWKA